MRASAVCPIVRETVRMNSLSLARLCPTQSLARAGQVHAELRMRTTWARPRARAQKTLLAADAPPPLTGLLVAGSGRGATAAAAAAAGLLCFRPIVACARNKRKMKMKMMKKKPRRVNAICAPSLSDAHHCGRLLKLVNSLLISLAASAAHTCAYVCACSTRRGPNNNKRSSQAATAQLLAQSYRPYKQLRPLQRTKAVQRLQRAIVAHTFMRPARRHAYWA